MTNTFDLVEVRRQFPALRRQHDGHPVAYFDGPGGTQVPETVADAMRDYLFFHNANTHWVYPSSVETDAMIVAARAAYADWFGCLPNEVVFGNNMTTLTLHISRALGRQWTAGDEIVVTELDHHANVDPWRELAADRGLIVRRVAFHPETGEHDWEAFAAAITPNTKLVAVGAASNALGTITDVARVAKLARAVGALVYVDAVHFAPHRRIDVKAMDADFVVCSSYKFCGPHVGILYGRLALLESLNPPKLVPAPNQSPDRFETGTGNHEGIAGALAAVEFHASLGGPEGTRRERLDRAFAAIVAHEAPLLRRLWEGLGELPRTRRFGPTPDRPRTGTMSFAVDGMSSDEVCRRLIPYGLYCSNGDFYAATVVERLGYAEAGLVRIGCAPYTTVEEIDRLLSAVGEIVRR
jgi:cysteine desulfurase family protein (TIGR01976 family)